MEPKDMTKFDPNRIALAHVGDPVNVIEEFKRDGKLVVYVNGHKTTLTFEEAVRVYGQKEYGE